MTELADGTGGTFYHNRNDVDEAMREAGAAPEVSYVLGFSPQNLKFDGRFHTLKVALTTKEKFGVQARHGYFAPRSAEDPAEVTKEEIQEALFSQEEIHDIPVDLQTQYFKKDEAAARLAVLTHLDVKSVRFRKASGRNNDRLTIVTGIFDENGQKNREAQFVYRVDVNGDVFKETQHVSYEVVAVSYEKIEEEVDPIKGDFNKATLLGRITKDPFFDFIGKETPIPFCSLNIGTKSSFFEEERMFFNNVITWSKLAETIFENFQKDDYIKIVGRLQSRNFEKEFVKRWKTPSGKRKKKSKIFTLTTREISATKSHKVFFEKEEQN